MMFLVCINGHKEHMEKIRVKAGVERVITVPCDLCWDPLSKDNPDQTFHCSRRHAAL